MGSSVILFPFAVGAGDDEFRHGWEIRVGFFGSDGWGEAATGFGPEDGGGGMFAGGGEAGEGFEDLEI